jgi:translocator protein
MSNRSYQVYKTLIKPPLSPPGWVFGPVWTVLYAMIAFAGFRMIIAGINRPEVTLALGVFFIQLLLNFLWPYLYFKKGLRGAAFTEIALLWIFIAINLLFFYRIDPLAGWLLAPYLMWVTFAVYLNGATWWLNR